jgi:hypothetical protein
MWMSPTLASLASGDTSAAARALITAVGVTHAEGVTMVFGTDGGVLPHGRGVDDPLRDVRTFRDVRLVMSRGRVVLEPPAAPPRDR